MISRCNVMPRIAKLTGFTLIELLIVMVILGLSSALLVPDMFSMLQRAQAKSEIAKMRALATLSVEKSFFSGTTIDFQFEESTLTIKQEVEGGSEARQLKVIESDYFVFEKTVISIVNGQWTGEKSVQLIGSPDNLLTELVLRDE